MNYAFDTIVELALPQGRKEWVMGVSSQGSVVLWNYQRYDSDSTRCLPFRDRSPVCPRKVVSPFLPLIINPNSNCSY